jgi:hypothetical protein
MESGSCGSSQLMSSFIIVKLEILRKMKKIYVLFMSSLLLLSCAKDDVSKPSEWPEWPTPSKPKIENAVLRGVNGETVVAAGDKVKFTAQISDEYNDLVISIISDNGWSRNLEFV